MDSGLRSKEINSPHHDFKKDTLLMETLAGKSQGALEFKKRVMGPSSLLVITADQRELIPIVLI